MIKLQLHIIIITFSYSDHAYICDRMHYDYIYSNNIYLNCNWCLCTIRMKKLIDIPLEKFIINELPFYLFARVWFSQTQNKFNMMGQNLIFLKLWLSFQMHVKLWTEINHNLLFCDHIIDIYMWVLAQLLTFLDLSQVDNCNKPLQVEYFVVPKQYMKDCMFTVHFHCYCWCCSAVTMFQVFLHSTAIWCLSFHAFVELYWCELYLCRDCDRIWY
jgi:hypothetical protein